MYMKLCKNVYNLNYLDIYFICVICNYYIKYKMIKQDKIPYKLSFDVWVSDFDIRI